MQTTRYSAQDEQELMARLWSPAIKDNPLAFVMFAYPWGDKGTPLEHFTGPRKWQREVLTAIADHIKENNGRLDFDVLRLAFDGDQASRVDLEYADDPEMYAAIYDTQQSKTDDLRQIYLENVAALTEQLQALPLQNGSTTDAVRQLLSLVERAGVAR